MPPFVQRWSDMAKAPKTVKEKVPDDSELGGLPSELLVDGASGINIPVNTDGHEAISDSPHDDGLDEESEPEAEAEPRYIVLKGKTVKHDGVVYNEHNIIPVTGVDAHRLLRAGVIADYNELLRRMMTAAPVVSVTPE